MKKLIKINTLQQLLLLSDFINDENEEEKQTALKQLEDFRVDLNLTEIFATNLSVGAEFSTEVLTNDTLDYINFFNPDGSEAFSFSVKLTEMIEFAEQENVYKLVHEVDSVVDDLTKHELESSVNGFLALINHDLNKELTKDDIAKLSREYLDVYNIFFYGTEQQT